jgi:hypothetical protein
VPFSGSAPVRRQKEMKCDVRVQTYTIPNTGVMHHRQIFPPHHSVGKLSTNINIMRGPLVGVLALQGAFEEHQKCLEAVGCRTVQVILGLLS